MASFFSEKIMYYTVSLFYCCIICFEILNFFKCKKAVYSAGSSLMSNAAHKDLGAGSQQAKQKDQAIQRSSLIWTEKYRPKVPNEMIGNPSLVRALVVVFQ
jgi:hypothetical protein